MFKRNLTIAFRHLSHNKRGSIINIAGLATGIAATLMIFLIIRFETSFDKDQPNFSNIYRIFTQTDYSTGLQYNSGVSYGVPDAIKTEFPQMENVAELQGHWSAQFAAEDKLFSEEGGIYFIAPSWFNIFKETWLAGTPAALAAPNTIVLAKNEAEKYFGSWQNAYGQLLKMDNLIPLKVVGILENPKENTDFPLRMVISFETFRQHDNYGYVKNDWSGVSGEHQVFVELPSNTNLTSISERLKTFSQQHYASQTIHTRKLVLLPLKDNHFDARYNYIVPRTSSYTRLLTLAFIGLLILLMAIINFVNMATAQAALRAKEVGIRKVLGSFRRQLITQLLTETALISGIALILGLLIAAATLPFLRQVTGLPADINIFHLPALLFAGIMFISVTILAGSYPAFVLSGYAPITALKKQLSIGGINIRRGLVITQFVISQIMLIGTIVAMSQVHLLQSADMGFNKEAVYTIPGFGNNDNAAADALKTQLKQYAGITDISLSSASPSTSSNWMSYFYFDNGSTSSTFNVDIKGGDADYVRTFGLKVIAGRNYNEGKHVNELLINETLAKDLGFHNINDAIGHTMKIGDEGEWRQITGVIKDFSNNSLKDKARPTVVMPWPDVYWQIGFRIRDLKMVDVIKEAWMKAFPGYVYKGSFLDQQMAGYYNQESQLSLMYRIFAGIAIFISCLGLYGMVAFMALQKRKEIGIRKVLGASVAHILYLFCKEFMILIAAAFIIAAPAGWWLMNSWLQSFALRTNIDATVYLTVILLSAIIALITIGQKAITAAMANPVKSIQTE